VASTLTGMTASGDPDEVYRQARTRARRTPTVLLRRAERRVVDQGRTRRPEAAELAELAAARAELSFRSLGGNRWPVLRGERRWWWPADR
jgi:hypothetical protein